jgi:hypothetical protein
MSSPKVTAKTAAKPTRRPAPSVAPKIVATKAKLDNDLSADAIKLAKEIERAFKQNDQVLSEEAMQALMNALCRVYAAQVEAGAKYTPITEGQVVSPTAVMLTASGLLRAANLAVFELGMWQSWTGR